MHVVGTAGHVDHGKSSLVKALTGMDPDRLIEEKERGLTIDIGFAWMTLPSGTDISIVDVPGHERFINNMLAGIGGIDMALLVVAADESVMPQTREHLAILDLLGITRGVVALTKVDLVDEELVELVDAEVTELLNETSLHGARIIPISSTTGQGLAELQSYISDELANTEVRSDIGRPRLSIDRSFSIPGFGTVVTGTLTDGPLKVGEEVELVLTGEHSRIRGLQTHKSGVDRILPGNRVAVNLSGVAHSKISRGEVLTTRGGLRHTNSFDAYMKVLSDIPRELRHNMYVTVHSGSDEVVGRLRLLDRDRAGAGDSVWAQLKLVRPMVVVKGDRFIIRSNQTTLGGGTIVEPHAERHRRKDAQLIERLEVMAGGSGQEMLAEAVHRLGPINIRSLADRVDMPLAQAETNLQDMEIKGDVVAAGEGTGKNYFSAAGWRELSEQITKSVEAYHRRFPTRLGAPKEELRSRLGFSNTLFGAVLERLIDSDVLSESGSKLYIPGHSPSLSASQERIASAFVASLDAIDPYSPPTGDLPEADILDLLEYRGLIVRTSNSVVFSTSAFDRMVETIRLYVKEHGEIKVSDIRDIFNTSRKYAVALVEHLDKTHVTRRVGDSRSLR